MEVGGTSTDISVIKNGRCPIRSAEVGGRKLHVSTLDIRTVGLAGGSLVYLKGGRISQVGPAWRPRNRALPVPRRRG